MASQDKTDFDRLASQWDKNPVPVRIANAVADAIIRTVVPGKEMEVLDFGCGTGLVTLRLRPLVGAITGADGSVAMIGKLKEKAAEEGITDIGTQLVDFENGGRVAGAFDLIVSSMTLHHVLDTVALLRHWHDLLRPGGRLAFADLDSEDGTFHADNTGVRHYGFDREKLRLLLQKIGFRNVADTTVLGVTRESGKEYPVFLITAAR